MVEIKVVGCENIEQGERDGTLLLQGILMASGTQIWKSRNSILNLTHRAPCIMNIDLLVRQVWRVEENINKSSSSRAFFRVIRIAIVIHELSSFPPLWTCSSLRYMKKKSTIKKKNSYLLIPTKPLSILYTIRSTLRLAVLWISFWKSRT